MDLAAAIATQHGAVLNEGHFQSLTSTRERCAHAGVATAHDDEIVFLSLWSLFRQSEQLAAQLIRGGEISRWCETFIAAEQNGIYTTIEACQVMQGHFDLAVHLGGARFLPNPVLAFGGRAPSPASLHSR